MGGASDIHSILWSIYTLRGGASLLQVDGVIEVLLGGAVRTQLTGAASCTYLGE